MGTLSLSDSTLSGNSADLGGGIYNASGTLKVYSNLFGIPDANQDSNGVNVNITGAATGSGNTPSAYDSGNC